MLFKVRHWFCVSGVHFVSVSQKLNSDAVHSKILVSSWTVGLKHLCDRMTSSLWHYSVCCHGNGRGGGQ